MGFLCVASVKFDVVRYWIVFLNVVSFTLPKEAADLQKHCDNQLHHQSTEIFTILVFIFKFVRVVRLLCISV
jgi:hypothetical protein